MAHPRAVSSRHKLPDGRLQEYTLYFFDKAGDEIPIHVHDNYWHSSSCMKGLGEAFDAAGKSVIVKPGKAVEFTVGREHGVRALVDNTLMIHIREPGK